MTFTLRNATEEDAAAIAAIYRHYVETSVATFEEIPPTEEEIAARIHKTLADGFPYYVAEEEGRVIGYCYAGLYRTRSAYRFTVENSIYVANSHRRSGVGSALMKRLIRRCTELGYRQMIAGISGIKDSPSIQLHAKLGFSPTGHMPSIGLKFGQWVDVMEMQLPLGQADATIPARDPGPTGDMKRPG